MRKVILVIPIMTLLADIAILLDIPILREILVFLFLSFIPGFAILGLFKLKEISFLDTFLFSIALSIAFLIFMSFFVNELFLFFGFSQPISFVPLTVSLSAFTLTVFFIEYRSELSETLKLKIAFEDGLKNVFPLAMILFFLPFLSAIGVFYFNVYIILLSYAIIAALCILSVVSRKLVPESLFPFLIFSISLALVCQIPLSSRYIVGYDANLEYYVFRLTQISGHWGFLNTNLNPIGTLNYNSMLSITLLPAVYSTLMNIKGDLVFKILYPFILSLTPLVLNRIFEKQFGKLVGLLSTLFFVFTFTAFYGPEILSLNRQIVGELFLLMSVFLLISKTIPVTERRLILIVFGAVLAVSHYSLAYIFLAIVALVFLLSRARPIFEDTINTLTVLALFLITFSYYAIGPSSPLVSLVNNVKSTFSDLFFGLTPTQSGTASTMFAGPQVFTAATWINLLLSGIANVFLIIGILSIILRIKGKGISVTFKTILIVAAAILVISLISPSIASTLNFTRFYGIALLFLSPCFVLGAQTFLIPIRISWTKLKRLLKRQMNRKNKSVDRVILLIAILLSAYFLSQVGFVNRVLGGPTHSYAINLDIMKTSSDPQIEIYFYGAQIPEQDVQSAIWLSSYKGLPSVIYADYASGGNVLTSYGLIPRNLISPLVNTTIPLPNNFVYLSYLNVADNIIITSGAPLNSSEIYSNLNESNLVYSNGYGEIWCALSP